MFIAYCPMFSASCARISSTISVNVQGDQEIFSWWGYWKTNSPRDHEMFSWGGLKKKSSHGLFVLTFHHETKRCSRDGGYFKKISPWDQEIHPVINLVLMVTEIGYGAIPIFTTRPRDVLVVGVYFKTISLRDKEIQNLPWDLLMVSWWSWWLEDQEIHYVINLVLVVAAQCSWEFGIYLVSIFVKSIYFDQVSAR